MEEEKGSNDVKMKRKMRERGERVDYERERERKRDKCCKSTRNNREDERNDDG